MAPKLFIKHSFWTLVIQSIQTILGTSQLITFANESSVQTANYVMAAAQAALGILSIWTADKNNNNIIDIAENEVVTVTATSPTSVTVDKENAAHGFAGGSEAK